MHEGYQRDRAVAPGHHVLACATRASSGRAWLALMRVASPFEASYVSSHSEPARSWVRMPDSPGIWTVEELCPRGAMCLGGDTRGVGVARRVAHAGPWGVHL